MKKTIILVVCFIASIATNTHAQFYVTPHPESSDQIAAQFPGTYSLGEFLAFTTGQAFSHVTVKVMPTKASATATDFSKMNNLMMYVSYLDSSGTPAYIGPYPVMLSPDATGGMSVSLFFPAVLPQDSTLVIILRGDLLLGADTVYDQIRCQANAGNTTAVSAFVMGTTTYVEKELAYGPVTVPDRTFSSAPQFSMQVGTFTVKAKRALTWQDIELRMLGDVSGYAPHFVNPRIVDELGNTLLSRPTGDNGEDFGGALNTPLHMVAGESRKFYVLTDVLSAKPGDFFQCEMVGGCGQVDPFGTVVSMTDFCQFQSSQLGEKVTYVSPAGVANVSGDGAPMVYPNPATDRFTVSCAACTVTVANTVGQTVRTASGTNEVAIERDGLPSGMYLVGIQSAGTRKVEKVIFQ